MLEVSRAAAEAINVAAAVEGVRDTGGLRIFVESVTEHGAALTSAMAARPTEGDEIITSAIGSRVFVEPDATPYITGKVLAVEQDTDGQRYFALHDRA